MAQTDAEQLAKTLSEELGGKTVSHVSFEPDVGFFIHLQDGSFVETGSSVKYHIPNSLEAKEARMRVFMYALDRMAKVASRMGT